MPERRTTLTEQIDTAMKLARIGAEEFGRQLRDRFEAAGLTPPTPPANAATDPDEAHAATTLGELRAEAEILLDGVTEVQSDRSVVIAALHVLAHVHSVVVHELGTGWRKTARPFTTPGSPQPVTLGDAVEYLAADRAQWTREAETSLQSAVEAAAEIARARAEQNEAVGQLYAIRSRLDRVLRPNAAALADCEWCGGTPCDHHADPGEDEAPEPPLSANLAAEVDQLVSRMYEAQARERSAARGRVSVYVDGRLTTGPDVFNVDGVESDQGGHELPVPGMAATATWHNTWPPAEPGLDLRQSRLTWDAREVVHRYDRGLPGEAAVGVCGMSIDSRGNRTGTWDTRDVTCPRCLYVLAQERDRDTP